MRFSIINREPEFLFDSVRDSLEHLISDNRIMQPRTEIRENEHQYTIKMMLAGINKSDIFIELNDNVLTVSAEAKFNELSENEIMHMSEFSYGKVEKSISFEKELETENCSSEFVDGILTITLPKKTEVKKETSKKIEIK